MINPNNISYDDSDKIINDIEQHRIKNTFRDELNYNIV